MKNLVLWILVALIGKAISTTTDIMFLSDIHLDYLTDLSLASLKNITVLGSRLNFTSWNKDPFTQTYIGQYGCNPTEKLFQMYLTEIKNEIKARGAKAVVFLGDINPHGANIDGNNTYSDSEMQELYVHMKLRDTKNCNFLGSFESNFFGEYKHLYYFNFYLN